MTDMIVDANSLYARSWYAAQRINPDPAEAVRLVLQTLCVILNPRNDKIGEKIDRLLFAWDGARKAEKNRAEKPPEYHETKQAVRDVLHFVFGAPNAEHQDFEGDDVVATAVYKSPADAVYVVSGDKDLMQLQGGPVRYYCLNEKATLSPHLINRKWGVKHPNQIAIALAIIGDPVDNIAGIPRWGPKKCQKLFEQIPNDMPFDKVVEAIDAQVPEELKEAFWSSLDRTLLHTDVPDVPEPAPIVLAKPRDVADLGIPGIASLYDEIWHVYGHARNTDDYAE
jgi:5'-3' exonuclease